MAEVSEAPAKESTQSNSSGQIIRSDEELNANKLQENLIGNEFVDTESNNQAKSIQEIVEKLVSDDSRIGWPSVVPQLPVNLHGWFRAGNLDTLKRLITDDMRCFIELGSWLGQSTKFILERSHRNSVVFAVDIWENSYFFGDDHYDKKTDNGFMAILNGSPIYDQFLSNLRNFQYRFPARRADGDGAHNNISTEVSSGLIPMKMDSVDALVLLKAAGIEPDLIYIDASHHYDYVVKDVTTALNLFPKALIVGDDWDNLDVRAAVKHVAEKKNKEIFVNMRTCWTFEKERITGILAREQAEAKQRRKASEMASEIKNKSSFSEALQAFKKLRKN